MSDVSEEDKEIIDGYTLRDMQFIYEHMTPMNWPFNEKAAGEYFLKKFVEMGGNPDD